MAHLVTENGAKGKVVGKYWSRVGECVKFIHGYIGIEHIPELVDLAAHNIQQDNPSLLADKKVELTGV